jgi:hypothetical protein
VEEEERREAELFSAAEWGEKLSGMPVEWNGNITGSEPPSTRLPYMGILANQYSLEPQVLNFLSL